MHGIVPKIMIGLFVSGLVVIRPAAQGKPDAAKIQNPIAATPESVAQGKMMYVRFCANCHGSDGKGGLGNDLTPPSPNLTGKEWKHGSTDGEIFDTIKNGVPPDFNMAAWGVQGFRDEDVWNVVNYVRSLAKK